ncbi:uncharacterized protein UTRI_00510_B [Ustilago trichophora]|uniref:Uncharacterized protein n=1 Tax=Ustilago trichophora TaxID=86804 RepID=A0A5C3DPD5_9BASI|nr:uncharacterized protein UTRI_00510_B [Ustilago trichophora]
MGSMLEDWTASLSFATSIDTVSAEDRTDSEVATPQASSFPSPPPRQQIPSRAAPIDVGRLRSVSSASDLGPHLSRPLYLSLDHNEPLTKSHPVSKDHSEAQSSLKGRHVRQKRHFGGAEEWVMEPLEQLKPPSEKSLNHRRAGDEGTKDPYRKTPPTTHPSTTTPPRPERRKQTSWQRPHINPGLPTSYSHDLHRAQSASPSASSKPLPPLPHALHIDSTASLPHPSLTTRRSSVGRTQGIDHHRSLPVLTPSPALYFEVLKDQTWPRQIVGSLSPSSSKPPSIASFRTHSRNDSLPRASSTERSYNHSRNPSLTFSAQTHPTSTEGSRPASAQSIEPPGSSIGGDPGMRFGTRRDNRDKIRFDTNPASSQPSPRLPMTRSQPILLTPPPSTEQSAPQERPMERGRSRPLGQGVRTSLVTTDLVHGPRYLEPYNSCEAIMLPRPRLRSRSLGTAPAIVVERVHAAPERFWQRETGDNGTVRVQLAPRSSVIPSPYGRGGRTRAQSEVAQPVSPLIKDPRLVLHEHIPPPLPPKDTPLPSSGLLPSKPLPPTPSPVASPLDDTGRESADSLEHLEAPELLERNREIDRDREAWREEHRSSLGANAVPLRDRLSPCLRDPSDHGTVGSLGRRRHEGAFSDSGHDSYTNPIKVHRLWNEDGTEQTFLVVHRQHRHPYGNRNRSVSSPDLRGAAAVSAQRPPFVQNLASRLSGLANKGRGRVTPTEPSKTQGRQSALQTTSGSKPDPRTPPHSAPNLERPFGKERRLVSDETVIIGKFPEPVERSQGVAVSPESQMDDMMNGASIRTARRVPMSGYRPAGTQDEIKAQLGDQTRLYTPQRTRSHRGRVGEQETGRDRLTWIDPGSNTVMQGDLIMPSSVRTRTRSDARRREAMESQLPWSAAGETQADRLARPTDLPSSVSMSCSDSNCSCQSGEQHTPPTAPPTRDSPVGKNATAQHLERGAGTQAAPTTGVSLAGSEFALQMEHLATRDSSISSETHHDLAVWDASSVNLDNLFFRPPPQRLPST